MTDKNKLDKDTDRDVRPSTGQESNENWDETGEKEPDTKVSHTGENARRIDEETNTSGYGSAQRAGHENAGPLDSDFGELPSEKRAGRNDSSARQGVE